MVVGRWVEGWISEDRVGGDKVYYTMYLNMVDPIVLTFTVFPVVPGSTAACGYATSFHTGASILTAHCIVLYTGLCVTISSLVAVYQHRTQVYID